MRLTSLINGKNILFSLCALFSMNAQGIEGTDIRAHLIIDGQSGEILQSYKPNEKRFPASTTKMLTLALLFDHMRENPSNAPVIQVSKKAAQTEASKIFLIEGDKIAYDLAINALLIKSANDVAVAIAEHIAGDTESFAALMNKRAKQWNMTNSNFTNPSGLSSDNHYTTACDLTKMTLALLSDYPELKKYPTQSSISYNGRTYGPYTTMRDYYPYTEIYKGGFIRASQRTLIASTLRSDHRLVGATLGIPKANSAYSYMSYQFNNLFPTQTNSFNPDRLDPKVIYPAQLLDCSGL